MNPIKHHKYQRNTIVSLEPEREKVGSHQTHDEIPQEISYSIVHAIPGRVRFRIPRIVKDSLYADKLKAVMESDSEITSVRINPTAASVVVKYRKEKISEEQMRAYLAELIQTAPNIKIQKKTTVQSAVESVFDALVNLIDSVRNVNNLRSAVKHKPPQNSSWERVLSTVRRMLKGLKSSIIFVLPKSKASLQ
ncbi:MAG: hypothetical protein KME64_05695 [Scytonematopsis contorta HA4267-MV1]|jgi:hypothetical protein|nr:hypothetical protein [Scytonematopsis contorta HA4267-MV1]